MQPVASENAQLQRFLPPRALHPRVELEAWRDAQLGSWLDASHRLLEPLSSGGFGHVFLAEHVQQGTLSAAKLALPGKVVAAAVLRREAELLARVAHPYIVAYRDYGRTSSGAAYLRMEYAPGVELESCLEEQGPLAPERALRVLRQLAAALDYLHAQHIVHADLKPTHIVLDERSDRIKLIDFGCAFDCRDERQASDVAGTPGYMAPEQVRGERCGPAIDVYGLAALASEVLTGKLPHTNTTRSVVRAVLRDPPALPSARGLIRPGLDAVFARALHKRPRERYESAGAFVAALEHCFAH